MRTQICDDLGIDLPIFAFSHCRDVVAAVSNAGGMGVLGVVGFSNEQLEVELKWLDEHVADGKVYAVDVVIPNKYEGVGEMDPKKLEAMLQDMVPDEHRVFAKKLYADHGVPEIPAGEEHHQLLGWTEATATPQVEIALTHPKVALIANALGTPPPTVIEEIHAAGRKVAALCGSPKQALAHKEAGVDIIIAQGTEGGGHTGEVGSMVLWPQVISAVAPTPVLAAGGISHGSQVAAAMALGAQGAWTGTLWLTVEESDTPPAALQKLLEADARDTVRSRSFTGKPCRMLRNEWTEAWEAPGNPKPLGMPLQMMVAIDAVARSHRYADKAVPVAFSPCGQVVGNITKSEPTRQVMFRLVEEFLDATERLNALVAD